MRYKIVLPNDRVIWVWGPRDAVLLYASAYPEARVEEDPEPPADAETTNEDGGEGGEEGENNRRSRKRG